MLTDHLPGPRLGLHQLTRVPERYLVGKHVELAEDRALGRSHHLSPPAGSRRCRARDKITDTQVAPPSAGGGDAVPTLGKLMRNEGFWQQLYRDSIVQFEIQHDITVTPLRLVVNVGFSWTVYSPLSGTALPPCIPKWQRFQWFVWIWSSKVLCHLMDISNFEINYFGFSAVNIPA